MVDMMDKAALDKLTAGLPQGTSPQIVEQLREAYHYAAQLHGDRRRESGETALDHAVAVASIVASLDINDQTLVAALLHDVLTYDDGKIQDQLYHLFGPEVRALVSGMRELYDYAERKNPRQHAQEADNVKLEQIRRAMLTMIQRDVRIIVIRLAVALQDLRRARYLPRSRRQEIANESMKIYSLLANRLGIWQLKWELEDRAFSYLEEEKYKMIASALAENREERNKRIERAISRLQSRIEETGLDVSITGRPKHIYSIYSKMQRKGLDFAHIYDVHALRVIIHDSDGQDGSMSDTLLSQQSHDLCYRVLGTVHNLWKPIPNEFDDYIATPKANGYKSLHTAVRDEMGHTWEIQIRTESMNREAELGIAAHWAYKEGEVAPSASDVKRIHWFRRLVQNLREATAGGEGSEELAKEFLDERIYVFTPRGDVVDLPAGSTPIDFAYQIHTEVGHRCRGARVNGKMVSLDYRLQTRDQVDIITASRGGPNRDWMNENLGFTGSARTRSKIRQWFRQQEKAKNIEEGRDVVERELRRLGISDVYSISDIAQALRFDDDEQFLASVGFGDIQTSQLGGAIASLQQRLKPDDDLLPLLRRPEDRTSTKGLVVRGVAGLHTKFAGCCNPIPPEPIKGYITRGRGITVHAAGCNTLVHISDQERLIDVEWGIDEETYPIPIVVRAYQRSGLVEDIANILKGRKIRLPKTKKTTANSITTVYMIAEISDLAELDSLLQRLEKVPNVFEAQRQRWE